MTTLPIKRIILYKHGVGYFERRGEVSGEEVRLSFPRPAMDDMLKSLVALDMGPGQVISIDYETPEDRAALLAKGSIHLSDDRSLLDLLRDLRGRQVRCTLSGGDMQQAEQARTVEGMVVGVDYEDEEQLLRAIVTLYQPDQKQVVSYPLNRLQGVELLDNAAAADLSYFLRAAQSEADRRSATLHLTPGEHDLLVGYIAPAPAWRVSYRMLFEPEEQDSAASTEDPSAAPGQSCRVLFQGWGLFDNQLEEDLEHVHLTLIAGMPVSFRYRLYEPHTPERPLIQDEERTVSQPIQYEGAPRAKRAQRAIRQAEAEEAEVAAMSMDMMEAAPAPAAASFAAADMEESVEAAASGGERGALFAYDVTHPVSVARGQSAMVPILSKRLSCRRELLYNKQKLPDHPVASLRMHNETGLTLERGPVTVLEDGIYAGEAVVPFTLDGAELIAPFAVELGIKVEEQSRRERRIAGISLRGEYLLFQEHDILHTTYHLTSTLAQETSVTVEHNRQDHYEFTDTAEPLEQGASFARWDVACPPDTRTVFEVHERRMTSRHEQVRNIQMRHLQDYMRDKFLDKTTFEGLQAVLRIYQQIGDLHKQLHKLERERETIYRKQKQVQGNLAPLGREGDERALRQRYVAELNQQEDRLAALAQEEQQHRRQIEQLEQQAKQRLQALPQGSEQPANTA
jgi:hypothetical protein